MARGYQGESGDVKALAMKKWLIQIIIILYLKLEDTTNIHLTNHKLCNEYLEAKELGIETKPMIIGAYTMLKLCHYTGDKKEDYFIDAFIKAYQDLLLECEKNQISLSLI